MNTTPVQWTHSGFLSEDVVTQFGDAGDRFKYSITIPAGTFCHQLKNNLDWVVADYSFIGSSDVLLRQDAEETGIPAPELKMAGVRHFLIDDQAAPQPTYYAVISSKAGHRFSRNAEEASLRRAGIELSEFDQRADVFYARLSPEARVMAQSLNDDFNITLHPRYELDENWNRNARLLRIGEMQAELVFHQFWLHNGNNLRSTAVTSDELDARTASVHLIQDVIRRRARPHVEYAESKKVIAVGDEITVPLRSDQKSAAIVTEFEHPDPEFAGCIHYRLPDGGHGTCHPADIGAHWLDNNGKPYDFEPVDNSHEEYMSGRWTAEDTASMERGRDLPPRNEAGEWMP